MTIALRGTANGYSIATGTITVAKPAGVVSGDVLFCLTANNGTSVTPFSGFTSMNTWSGAFYNYTASYRVCDGTEPSTWTFNVTPGGGESLLFAVSGANTTSPFENPTIGSGATGNGANPTVAFSNISVTYANSWWVKFSTDSNNNDAVTTQPLGNQILYYVGPANGGSLTAYQANVNAGYTGLDNVVWTVAPGDPTYDFIVKPASTSTPNLFRMYAANGDFQAHQFVQGTLPANTAMRMYSNNVVHTASIVLKGDGKIRLYSNGQLSVNNTIIV